MEQLVYLKACRRCKGDLFYNKDHFGPYLNCLQCGQEYYGLEVLLPEAKDVKIRERKRGDTWKYRKIEREG